MRKDTGCEPSLTLAAPLQQVDRTYVLEGRKRLSYFGGCDYFRLASHPAVLKALRDASETYGLNVAASRVTTGNHVLYHDLEIQLACFFGVEAATLVSTGYNAPIAAAQALAGEFSHVFIDRDSHPCLTAAATFFEARVIKFNRGDVAHLRGCLKRCRPRDRVIILTEGVYAHSGELPPLAEYLDVLPRNGILLVDDAHGAGTLGPTGKGAHEELGLRNDRLIVTTTLSKAFGVYGGMVLGSRQLQQRIRATSSIFVGSTPLPLPLVAAAAKSVEILATDPRLRKRLRNNTARVKESLKASAISRTHAATPIVSLVPENPAAAAKLRKRLLAREIYPSFICYPGGPPQGYYRFAISSEHTRDQLEALVEALQATT